MRLPICLGYSAATPVDPRVVDKMVPWLYAHFGNPAPRSHSHGWEAGKAAVQFEARFRKAAVEDYRSEHGAKTDLPAVAEAGCAGEKKAV